MFFQELSLRYNLTREIKELYTSVAIKDFAVSMIALFEPIFLYYELHLPLYMVMLFYAVIYTPYIFLLPFSGKIACKFGFEHSMAYATPFFIIYLALLYASRGNPNLIWLAALIICAYKIFYWPSYNANFARYSNQEHRAKILTFIRMISTVLIILGPILGGLILKFFGFSVLFIVASFLMFVSFIPMMTTKEKFYPSHFSYWKTIKMLIRRKYIKQALSFMGFAEELSIMTFWPIFMFLTFDKNFMLLGIIAATSSLGFSLFGFYIGRLIDKKKEIYKVLRPAIVVQSLIWFLKMLSRTIFEVGLLDILHWGNRGAIYPTQFSIIYKKANQHGNLRYMIFHEMALAIGKAGIAWILFFIFLNFGEAFYLGFAISGIIGLLYLFL